VDAVRLAGRQDSGNRDQPGIRLWRRGVFTLAVPIPSSAWGRWRARCWGRHCRPF
jgi:hypothetical protein